MKIINSLLRWYFRRRIPALRSYWQAPVQAQEILFKSLITNAQNTSWGKQYDYKSIQHIATYQQRVPISTYDELAPYIQRMMRGERDVLWRGLVPAFSKSSGTTSDKSKYIPVSEENLYGCHLKGTLDTSSWWYERNPHTQWFTNAKGLVMGGSWRVWNESPRIIAGDISALMMQYMPPYAKYFQTPDLQTALLDNWEEKIEKMVKMVSREPVTNISGVPTWTIVLLQKILDFTGKSNVLEVFPNFEVYMHGGVSFAPYREQFKTFFPSDTVQYREIYNASEGFFAAQVEPHDDSMLLYLTNGVFFEFIPLAELDQPNPRALTVADVELNQQYAMVISTNAGLWRYLIGDTVKFTSLYPHKIQITGRTKHFINAFGEEVMVENTDRALAQTCQQFNARVRDYTVAPIYLTASAKGGHQWLIEFEHEPLSLETFANQLDINLQQLNSDYEAKRSHNIALQCLTVQALPQGTFHGWLKSKGKLGGQNKVPRLANHRQYVEEILQFLDNK